MYGPEGATAAAAAHPFASSMDGADVYGFDPASAATAASPVLAGMFCDSLLDSAAWAEVKGNDGSGR